MLIWRDGFRYALSRRVREAFGAIAVHSDASAYEDRVRAVPDGFEDLSVWHRAR